MGQKADVFPSELIPSVPVRQAVDYYEAFNLQSPSYVLRDGIGLYPVFKDKKKKLTKKLAFSQKPTRTDEDIETKQKKKSVESIAAEAATTIPERKPARHPGRPKGSKNKKTLEREAEMKRLGVEPLPKRGRGRPKGSKNKKTLEREALQNNPSNMAKKKKGKK